MRTLKKVQKDREKFLYTLLEYDSNQKEFNPTFNRDEMIELLNIDEEKFNKIQQSLGDQYCSFVDIIRGKSVYKIHTSQCWYLHDEFENWKLTHKLKNFTITLMLIAFITILVALPQSIESFKSLFKKSQIPGIKVESLIKKIDSKNEQNTRKAITNESEPGKQNGAPKPTVKTNK